MSLVLILVENVHFPARRKMLIKTPVTQLPKINVPKKYTFYRSIDVKKTQKMKKIIQIEIQLYPL